MAKRRKTSKRGGVLWAIILLVIIFFTGVLFNATNGFTTALKSFHVIYNEEYILNNENGLFIKEGDVFEVKQYSDSSEAISVEIYAIKSAAKNTNFTYSGLTTSWNESVANKKVTQAFDIKIEQPSGSKNGMVTVVSGDVIDVIKSFVGEQEISLDKYFSIKEDMFRMVITVGDEQMTLDFSVQMEALGVYFKNGLVF